MELNDKSWIVSSSGYTAKIDYSGKGWLSGKKNSFVATMFESGKEKEKDVLYTVSGQWTKSFDISRGNGKKGGVVESYDAEKHPTTPLSVKPVEQQDEMESRRAWAKVADGIAKGDMDAVGAEKTKIEVRQREMRQKEKEEGRGWERRFFRCVEGRDEVLETLGPKIGLVAEADKTGGVWRFDGDKKKAVGGEKGELK